MKKSDFFVWISGILINNSDFLCSIFWRYFNKAMSSPYDSLGSDLSTFEDAAAASSQSSSSAQLTDSSQPSNQDYDVSTKASSSSTTSSTTTTSTTSSTTTTTTTTTTSTATTTTTVTTTTESTTSSTPSTMPSGASTFMLPATTRHVAAAAYLGNLKKELEYKSKQANKINQMAPMSQQLYADNLNEYLFKKQQQQALKDYHAMPNGIVNLSFYILLDVSSQF